MRGIVFGLAIGAFALAACGGASDREVPAEANEGEDTAAGAGATADSDLDPPRLRGVASLDPVDEAARDTSLLRFRAELLRAVGDRDTAFLYSIVADDIRNTFGDDNGREAFRRIWQLSAPGSEVWPVLERILQNGGRFQAGAGEDPPRFMAPYVYAAWPEDFDAFQYVASLGRDVVVREQPDPAAPPLGTIENQIISVAEWAEPASIDGWVQIRLAGGRLGWVAASDVYSPVGWRAIFEKRGGDWVMTVLIAGD